MKALKKLIKSKGLSTFDDVQALLSAMSITKYSDDDIRSLLIAKPSTLNAVVDELLKGKSYTLNNQNEVSDNTIDFFSDKIMFSCDNGITAPYVKSPTTSSGNVYYMAASPAKGSSPLRESYILNRGEDIGYKAAAVEFEKYDEQLRVELATAEIQDIDFYSSWKYCEYKPSSINEKTGKEVPASINMKQVSIDRYISENTSVADDSRLLMDEVVVPFTNDPKQPTLAYYEIKQDNYISRDDFKFINGWLNNFVAEGYQDAFEKYIASIYCDNNKGRQALYLHDPVGASLKSKMIDGILKYSGNMAMGISEKNINTRFGIPALIGKRLLTIGDSKNANIIKSEVMHNILGGDTVMGEYKGGSVISVKIHAKVIIASNEAPDVSFDKHEKSRIIVIPIVRPDLNSDYMKDMCKTDSDGNVIIGEDGDVTYKVTNGVDKIINDEMPKFIEYCINKHYEYVNTNADIKLTKQMSDDLEVAASTPYNEFITELAECIVPMDNKAIKPSTINSIGQAVYQQLGVNGKFIASNIRKNLESRTDYKVCKASQKLLPEFIKKHNLSPNANLAPNVALDDAKVKRLLDRYTSSNDWTDNGVKYYSMDMEATNYNETNKFSHLSSF